MSQHRIKRNEFRLGSGAVVSIEYWAEPRSISVAAYGADGHQVSLASYSATIDSVDDFKPGTQESLIDSMANMLEYDLMNHPEVYLRQR